MSAWHHPEGWLAMQFWSGNFQTWSIHVSTSRLRICKLRNNTFPATQFSPAVDVFACFSFTADSSLLSVRPIYVKVDLSPALMARLILDRFLLGLEGEMREYHFFLLYTTTTTVITLGLSNQAPLLDCIYLLARVFIYFPSLFKSFERRTMFSCTWVPVHNCQWSSGWSCGVDECRPMPTSLRVSIHNTPDFSHRPFPNITQPVPSLPRAFFSFCSRLLVGKEESWGQVAAKKLCK